MVLKPLRIQTLRDKSGGTWHIMSPTSEKLRENVPRDPHQIASLVIPIQRLW